MKKKENGNENKKSGNKNGDEVGRNEICTALVFHTGKPISSMLVETGTQEIEMLMKHNAHYLPREYNSLLG